VAVSRFVAVLPVCRYAALQQPVGPAPAPEVEHVSKRNGSFKGCCRMCATHLRGEGASKSQPLKDLRKVGKKRRVGRREIPADQRN